MGSHANKSPPAGLTSGRWDAGQLLGRQMVLQDKGLRLLGMGAERADLGSAWEAVSRKQIARPRITGGRAPRPTAPSISCIPQGIRELDSKLLANAISEIAICLIRLNDLMRVTGYVDRIDQIIGRPCAGGSSHRKNANKREGGGVRQ